MLKNNTSEYIFISYSRKDFNVLHNLKHFLEENSIKYWTDESIEVGTPNWRREVDKAIRESNGIIVLLSPDARESQWVFEEIALAQLVKKPIIPLLIKGEPAYSTLLGLILAQYIDLRFDWESGCRKLVAFLTKSIFSNSVPKQTTTGTEPLNDTIVFPDTSLLITSQEPSMDKIWSIFHKHITEPEWHDPIIQAVKTSKYTDNLLEKLLKSEQRSKLKHFPLLLAVSALSGENEVENKLRQKIITDAISLTPTLPWQPAFLWDSSIKDNTVYGSDIWYQLAQIPVDEFLKAKYLDILQDHQAMPEMRISTATILENFVALEGFALGKWDHDIVYNYSAVTTLFLKREITRLKRILDSPGLNHELGLKTARLLVIAKENDFVETYLFKILDQLTSTDNTEILLIRELFNDLKSKKMFLKIATSDVFPPYIQEDAIDSLVKLGYIEEAAKLYFNLATSRGKGFYNPYIMELGKLGQTHYLEKLVKSAKGKPKLEIDSGDPFAFLENTKAMMNDVFFSALDFENKLYPALFAVRELANMGEMERLKELSNDEDIHWEVKERILSELEKGNKNGK